jgi:dolichol-phosphate mannosyltransferase
VLSVIVPVYNEAATVLLLLRRLLAVKLPVDREIIIVDDGSQDGTRDVLKAFHDPAVRCVFHEKNQGKGMAIRTGLSAAKGDLVLIQDADLEYDPNDIPALLVPALQQGAKVVYGSRILRTNPASYFRYYWGGRFVSLWCNLLFGSNVTDEPTGYKLFSTELLRSLGLKCTGFEFCPEATAKILKRGIEIREVPISYAPRTIEEGKKINWRDGIIALWTLLRYRF